jgi:transposase
MPYYGLATRAQAVVMRALGTPLKAIAQVTGISTKHIGNLLKKAVENGWHADWVLLNDHLKDKPGRGRKKKITPDLKQKVINAVTCDRYGRKKSTRRIARETGLSPLSIRVILKKYGYRKTKPIRKPRLTTAIKSKRYKFALAHRYWTLED